MYVISNNRLSLKQINLKCASQDSSCTFNLSQPMLLTTSDCSTTNACKGTSIILFTGTHHYQQVSNNHYTISKIEMPKLSCNMDFFKKVKKMSK